MKTASYTVMFTDIQGFTARTSRQTRAENERLLRFHDALLLPVVQGYLGRRVKTIGDAYLVVFDSATRALACGAAIQDRLAAYNRNLPDGERIDVRIALSAGEVRVERGDVFGATVNIASRVEGLAAAGEVCFTESVYLLADRSCFDVVKLGPRTLKGIPEPVEIFRLRRDESLPMPYGGGALESLGLPEPTPEALVGFWRPGAKRLAAAAAVAVAAIGGYGAFAWLHRT
ncbi:adenylate/guanylate cyclase domain-containing protein [Vulgatibacter incomptus]|uniref:Adenylate cyclase n=1 Tax=Vulgatibacter incomptus TaxID=1391653 RepID=A0A0K1PAE8_9BACT|nr:adenylate/guanylate cyclase domain-containing protein [Vulgatibacter incomptus]AKU90477.1 Adenylate cyclase [Vulgatibacter incomptus]